MIKNWLAALGFVLLLPQISFGFGSAHTLGEVSDEIHNFYLDHGNIQVHWQTLPSPDHHPYVAVAVGIRLKNANPKGGIRGAPASLDFKSVEEMLTSPYLSVADKNEIRRNYLPRFQGMMKEIKAIESAAWLKAAKSKSSVTAVKEDIKTNIKGPIQKALMGIPNVTVSQDF
jgi:hypothetical protein